MIFSRFVRQGMLSDTICQKIAAAADASVLDFMNSSPRPRRWSARNVTAVLGPTNTGKTHLAVERMLAHGTGMIGLPLRLLAREIYDRVVKARGARSTIRHPRPS